MRQVPVNVSWVVNAFENNSAHSEYYLDMRTGDVRFFSPMDFPEHVAVLKKLDQQPERFIKLPKRDKEFCLKVKREYASLVEDAYLKGLLEKALNRQDEQEYRQILMEFENDRRRWYSFENDQYRKYLLAWFRQRGIELVDKPPVNNLVYNKKK